MREHQEYRIGEKKTSDDRVAGRTESQCVQHRSSGGEYVEDDIRRYRRNRYRRGRMSQCDSLSLEDRTFISFARAWAPFGGVPAEETFIQFGMTTSQFTRRVNRILLEARGSS